MALRLTPGLLAAAVLLPWFASAAPSLHKVRDVVVYSDPRFHAAFPSVVRRPDGELLLAFRRAPDRQALGEAKTSHVDPNSQLVMVRSRDGGLTWSPEPRLLYAHPLGGSQDPCLLQLRDGGLLCASYAWQFVQPAAVTTRPKPNFEIVPGVLFRGGFLLSSADGGRTWDGPWEPPHVPAEQYLDPYGRPLPAYNRGAPWEARDGRILWSVAATDQLSPARISNHLLTSRDRGKSWEVGPVIASDERVTFNETSVYETPAGDVLAFLRTAGFEDQACVARSRDGGRSFGRWEGMGFQGHPLQAMRLPDQRILLVYGYRHPPRGVRARILEPEGTDFRTAPEIVLRDDGGSNDLGYPWAVQVDDRRVLVAYYFQVGQGPRHIAATLLEWR